MNWKGRKELKLHMVKERKKDVQDEDTAKIIFSRERKEGDKGAHG